MGNPSRHTPFEEPFNASRPEYLDGFVGRVQELNRLRECFSLPTQEIAFIAGEYGSGKTSLIRVFSETAKDLFPGGIHCTYGWGPESPAQFVHRLLPKRVKYRALLVVDEADALPVELRPELRAILAAQPKLGLLMAGRDPFVVAGLSQSTITLGAFTEAEFKELISRGLSAIDQRVAQQLWEKFEGSPLVANLANKSVREGLLELNELARELSNFESPGILGPDGRPLRRGSTRSKQLIAGVIEVNDELLHKISSDPSTVYSLGSRKFEEVVAELLIRQGYTVELTPASKDGGFDMYAARKETLGEFLYLVECKKYAPTHKVGVQIVRSLHGVVQQKRATAGVIATTSCFTRGAEEFQQEVAHQMHLTDYVELQKWLRGAFKGRMR